MRERRLKKTLAFIVMITMVFTMAYTPLGAAYAATTTVTTWTALDGIDEAAAAENPVAITMTDNSQNYAGIYALPAATTSTIPLAKSVELKENVLCTDGEKEDYGWTVTKSENADDVTYTFQNSEGKYLYLIADNKGVRVGNKPADTGGDWNLTAVSGSNGVMLDYLNAGTSDAVRFLGVYQGTDWRCYKEGSNGSFPGNIKDQYLQFWEYAGKEEIEEPDEPEVPTNTLDKLAEAPADGAKVAIYHPKSGMALTATASGAKLAGVEGKIEGGKLTVAENAVIMDVSENNGVYQFTGADGKVLTSAPTGNGLSFAADASSDLAKWKAEKQADGTWYLMNVGANYNGNYNQALEYYSGFTTYGVNTDNADYKLEFYGEQGVPKLSKIDFAPQDGAELVIYHPTSKMALTSEASGDKLAGTEAVAEGGKIVVTDAMTKLSVSLADGKYTFASDGKYLTSAPTGNGLSFAEDGASNLAKWTIEKQADGTWYLMNVGANYNGNYDQALEYYSGFTTYGVKTDNNAYKFEFYGKSDPAPDDPPTPPTGDDFGLVSKIETGDEVILYNAANKMGVGNSLSGYNIAGISLTEKDGVITTDKAAAVWTVAVNEDGTYTFTQGEKTLGGVVSGTYNNLVPTGATFTNWTLTGPDEEDFNYFLYLGDMQSSHGKVYLEYYNGFTLYGDSNPGKDKYGITFYKKGAEPETPEGGDPGEIGDLITDLNQLEEGATVAIYSPSRKTAISSVANGDWYLKAKAATITTEGKLDPFTTDYIWRVKVNSDGTYSFYSYDNEADSITVWPSFTRQWYAELTVNTTYNEESVNTWNVKPAGTGSNTFTIASATLTDPSGETSNPAYIRANSADRFAGSFVANPSGTDYALQFYRVDPENAVADFDDGDWDGVLEKGSQYVIYNESADAVLGLYKDANNSYDAVPTEFTSGTPELAIPGNGAYAFTVDSMGRYYTFKVGDKYMASNNAEELYLEEAKDGVVPGNAKWYLEKNQDGYVIYNKEANYKGSAVCIEYFSSVFSGWTFKSADADIFRFKFYKVAEESFIHENVVQVPTAIFDCEDFRYVEQAFNATITLEDLCPEIVNVKITYTLGERTGEITDYTESSDKKNYTFVIPAEELDIINPDTGEYYGNFDLTIEVTNGFGNSYTVSKPDGVGINDLPFFEDLTPAPGSQTGEDLKPVISAKVCNAGEGPEITMAVNDEEITDFTFEGGVVSYKPAKELSGKTTVRLHVKRADGMISNKNWSFTAGISEYQLYFGQLHSHTTYSDGSGTLDTALDYIASLPESANVQFVAFTDHSNYFDSTSAANPADALNDKSKMTDASRARWEEYKGKVAAFNAKQNEIVAIGGFEMTWSGGPGHINTFNSDGLVSRNNAELNNKTNDAGMKLYYETINKGDSMSQFNHPGTTFGNFTDFSYWDEETDDHMFLVEVGNGEGQIGTKAYYPSYEEYILALDKGWHVAPTNNQDNHKGLWGNANDARDVVLTNRFTEEGIYEAIRERRIYATEDKNLQISYTVNGEPMGTILKETPESLSIDITNFDPDNIDLTQKVELVANGGKVVKTWTDDESITKGIFTAEIRPEYSYYFVRITQEDEDLAVTAPVWVGEGIKAGIKEVKASEKAVVGREATLTTTFFNNENSAASIKSIICTTDGSKVLATDTTGYDLPAGANVDVPLTFVPDEAKRMSITVTAVVDIAGTEQTYTQSVTLNVRESDEPLPITPIATVQAQTTEGIEFAIEGVVTSNASGFDKDTAFFDCIYVQDETGGICCFPVSGDYKIGDKVHIEGYTDFYLGESELQVESIEVIGEGTVEPVAVTSAEINDQSKLGSLVTLSGTVESFEEANGLIQTIMIKDAKGDVARVFIDGYITTENEVVGCKDGTTISATGLASYDESFNAPDGPFPRIRIRNRADIVCGISAVEQAINALPDEVTTEDETAIEAASAMYDALSDDEKAEVEELLPKLEIAKARLTAAKAEAAAAAAQAEAEAAKAEAETAQAEAEAAKAEAETAQAEAEAAKAEAEKAKSDAAKAAEAQAEAEKAAAAAAKAQAEAEKAAAEAAEAQAKAETAAAVAEAARAAAEEKAQAASEGATAETARADAALALAANVVDSGKVVVGNYKTSTAEPFKAALEAAEQLIKNPNASAEELRAANEALAKASEGLVLKLKNTMTVKGKKATVRASKLRKKAQKVKRSKALTIKNAKGKLTFKKVSGNKKITINKTTGKITVKKGLKRGTYKIKVKVTAAGNSDYKGLTVTRTFRIRVK